MKTNCHRTSSAIAPRTHRRPGHCQNPKTRAGAFSVSPAPSLFRPHFSLRVPRNATRRHPYQPRTSDTIRIMAMAMTPQRRPYSLPQSRKHLAVDRRTSAHPSPSSRFRSFRISELALRAAKRTKTNFVPCDRPSIGQISHPRRHHVGPALADASQTARMASFGHGTDETTVPLA